jgi:hypothetical protein
VLSPEESLSLASSLRDVECLIITSEGRPMRSSGWHRFERPRPPLPAQSEAGRGLALGPKAGQAGKTDPATKDSAPWDQEFELVVSFEINRPEDAGRGYRRPYVAIWVENKDGFPVRNLTLWVSMGGAGPFQWIPDLKRWYRADQVRKQVDKRELIFTMARPTRPPGKYKVIWDGKDDHGKLVDRGEYTLFIDAAREHGTYQNIRKPLNLTDKPFTEELKGNIEIKSASIEFRRKARAGSTP